MSAPDDRLSGALQENLLCLLCFNDDYCKLVRAAVTPKLFESSVFREVAGQAIDFIDQFGEPIKEHLADSLEHILEGDDARKASAYKRLLDNLFLAAASVNAEYVISQLHKFVRQQNLKSAVIRATEALEDGRVDEAETALESGLRAQVTSFEPGLVLGNAKDVESLLDDAEAEGFELGIKELDNGGVIPRRKELMMLIAPRGRGKSWFLTHCAKQALLQRWSVLVVTLEMSEKRWGMRMVQSFFAVSRGKATTKITRLVKDREGDLGDLIIDEVEQPSLRNDDDKQDVIKRAKREFARRKRLVIKEWPSGTLTAPMFRAYLDGLERFHKFTPDLIIVDYPDLMQLDTNDMRTSIGRAIVDIRGIASERNAATVVVSQGNRESETAIQVTGNMAAEDISKLATADTVLTYSQTKAEHSLGLARLFVEKARNEESKYVVLITQAYNIGQFCIDSHMLAHDYWDMVEDKTDGPKKRRRRDDDDE